MMLLVLLDGDNASALCLAKEQIKVYLRWVGTKEKSKNSWLKLKPTQINRAAKNTFHSLSTSLCLYARQQIVW